MSTRGTVHADFFHENGTSRRTFSSRVTPFPPASPRDASRKGHSRIIRFVKVTDGRGPSYRQAPSSSSVRISGRTASNSSEPDVGVVAGLRRGFRVSNEHASAVAATQLRQQAAMLIGPGGAVVGIPRSAVGMELEQAAATSPAAAWILWAQAVRVMPSDSAKPAHTDTT